MPTEAQQDFALAFLGILFEGAPFIFLGTFIGGLIDAYLPAGMMDRLLPKNKKLAVLVSGLLGLFIPVCECAVVPVIRKLVKKGMPVSCGITYMLAAPIVNPITALSTWKAFQGQEPMVMTSSRLALGFLLAVSVGLVVTKLRSRSVLRGNFVDNIVSEGFSQVGRRKDRKTANVAKPTKTARAIGALRSSVRDFVEVGCYFTVGVALTALFNTGIAPGVDGLDRLATNPVLAPAAMMALAFILSLCSTSDAFIAATLDKFTWSAKLAFLTFGPIMDLKLLLLYGTLLKRWFIVALATGLFIACGVLSTFAAFLIN